jgi:hypothetical protein
LRVENDHGNLVAPYLDEVGAVSDHGENLVIESGGDLNAQETSGEINPNDGSVCDCCGEQYDDDDMSVIYTNSRMTDSESWCEHCRGNNAFYCEGEREYFADSVYHLNVDDETYTQRYIDNNDVNYCEYYEQYTFGDVSTVIVDADGDTQHWSEGAISSHAFKYNGDYYSNDLDYTRVVVERYVLRLERSWRGNAMLFINAWFIDKTEKIPCYLIDDGEIEIVEGKDGRTYLRGYIDHYPLARERFDIVQESESLAA